MHTLFKILAFISLSISTVTMAATINSDCTFKGKKLYGNVKFVKNFADIRVKYVNNFEDIRVKMVDNFATSCGLWKVDNNFPDFTVEVVDNFEDIKVKIVNNFEGIH